MKGCSHMDAWIQKAILHAKSLVDVKKDRYLLAWIHTLQWTGELNKKHSPMHSLIQTDSTYMQTMAMKTEIHDRDGKEGPA
mmetsp:Transcript_42658/g.84146  ORF Transcript_42658/g.84146 Transcript_42658/m.84146 type:complete len:81 (+) Transcript_42658:182-424(+)